MNGTVFELSLREFVSQRRSLLLLLLAAVPVVLAIIVRLSNQEDLDRLDWMTNTLMSGIVITTVLPLSCLLLGTATFGNEIDSGTVLYLLTKPISRGQIVMAKFFAAVLLTGVFIVTATAVAGLIAMESAEQLDVVVGFTVAAALGVFAYTALFILLSLLTERALLIGLAYILVWEAIGTQLFSATAYLSVREYCLGAADLLSNVSPGVFDAQVAPVAAPLLAIGVSVGALLLATRSLERLQIREPD